MKLNTKQKKYFMAFAVVLAVVALLLPFIFGSRGYRTLQANGKTVYLEVASTKAARDKGLSGRIAMSNTHGMLFTFAAPAKECFWMKDMQFPLDMVWLNGAKKVTLVEKNVSPDTYPKAFCSQPDTKYVIELNAGQASSLGVKTGETLKF